MPWAHNQPYGQSARGFTILELLVAVSVTALLAAMLLNITSQVVSTQTQASGDLETNQVAQYVLDRIQEDLQCAISRNDGNVWMAAKILVDQANSGEWVAARSEENAKPLEESLRVFSNDWPEEIRDERTIANGQGPLAQSRFGMAGTWLRFFTQAPEINSNQRNHGSPRAVSYQIVRYGLTGSPSSRPRYQLFRSDVTAENTFKAFFNLDTEDGNFKPSNPIFPGANNPRLPQNLVNPILVADSSDGTNPASFSMASNVIDFGMRAYVMEKNSKGTGFLKQIFPRLENAWRKNSSNHFETFSPQAFSPDFKEFDFYASTHPDFQNRDQYPSYFNSFPDVVDVMVRILTTEGESAISALEEGLTPVPETFESPGEYWWALAERYSEVYVRRIKVFASSI